MSFKFLVTNVIELPSAKKAVLDGALLDGAVKIGAVAHLQGVKHLTLVTIEGVELSGSVKPEAQRVSLAVSLKEARDAGIARNSVLVG